MKSRRSLDYDQRSDFYSKDEYKKVFFDFLLETPDILNKNWISIDLMPDDPNPNGYDAMQSQLNLMKLHPDLFAYIRTGYQMEIREVRYLTNATMQSQLNLMKLHPDLFAYIRTGYQMEIREVRYLTILVAEWVVIKEDLKIYQLLK